jgi:hypothetical protein
VVTEPVLSRGPLARGVVRAEVTTFLLEKSRLSGHAEGESCFHCFYQLIAHAGDGRGLGLGDG